jgi:hypothetical protein
MSTEEPPVRPKRSSGGPTTGTTLGLFAALVALLLGFFILRDIRSDDTAGGGGGGVVTVPSSTSAAPDTTASAPSTTAPLVYTGYKVMVANASGVGGTAGQLTIALQGKSFIVVDPTNKAASEPVYATTKVFYLSGNEAGAESVARVLGGVCIEPMPASPPTEKGSLGEASVLVMLGSDLAGKPLPPTADAACGGTITTVTPDQTDPAATGDTTTTTVAG